MTRFYEHGYESSAVIKAGHVLHLASGYGFSFHCPWNIRKELKRVFLHKGKEDKLILLTGREGP
jgi:hypothetical protein